MTGEELLERILDSMDESALRENLKTYNRIRRRNIPVSINGKSHILRRAYIRDCIKQRLAKEDV